MERQSWDDYFMVLATAVTQRSTCLRRQIGAIAVDTCHKVIGTGYNGTPSKLTHCTKDTCVRTVNKIPSGQRIEVCRAIHAEQNIVLQCGERLHGATIYCTAKPCITCFKLLYGAGVRRIVWKNDYEDDFSTGMMEECGMVVERGKFFEWVRETYTVESYKK